MPFPWNAQWNWINFNYTKIEVATDRRIESIVCTHRNYAEPSPHFVLHHIRFTFTLFSGHCASGYVRFHFNAFIPQSRASPHSFVMRKDEDLDKSLFLCRRFSVVECAFCFCCVCVPMVSPGAIIVFGRFFVSTQSGSLMPFTRNFYWFHSVKARMDSTEEKSESKNVSEGRERRSKREYSIDCIMARHSCIRTR